MTIFRDLENNHFDKTSNFYNNYIEKERKDQI